MYECQGTLVRQEVVSVCVLEGGARDGCVEMLFGCRAVSLRPDSLPPSSRLQTVSADNINGAWTWK